MNTYHTRENMPVYKIEDLPDLMTIVETASVLRVMPLTLKRWEKAGKIHPIRINSRGDRRYKKIDILKILNPMIVIPSGHTYEH